MSDLIKALIQVKDPLTLAAFFSAVLLLAFRTPKVPEMFFELLKEKLTKERFAQVLHRFMVLGFSSLCVLCAVAIAGQILASKTQAQARSLADLRIELANLRTPEDKSTAALNSYAEGLARINAGQLAEAIAALKASVDQVPTLTAQYTLAYLYGKRGDHQQAQEYAVKASALAQTRGDSLAEVSVERLSDQAQRKPRFSGSGAYYSGSFDGSKLNPEWKIVNPDPARWTMQPTKKSVMIITQKGPCFNMKNGKDLLLLDKQLPTDDFEVIVKASAEFQGREGNQIAIILFNDEANYFWMPLQNEYNAVGNPPIHVYFQKIFQGQQTGSFQSVSSNHVYLKIDRIGNDYSGYFANLDPANPANVDQIQWTRLGTLPWIRFQGKLAICAVNAFGEPPEVAAEFYSVLIRKK